ncbi:peptidylprolyl isomerase [uncultured Anaerococcus sp.]|uniref:peptidylprolyl isomerase n=1 Tax=uncultured Anaerococcus sp. TaxID=293428 RepID=UPI0025F64847|nr:peptidylprolyl isomerase [uncultured Anaerococcus sp.]
MTENKLLAEVNGKKIYLSDVYELMQGMPDKERFNNDQGINVLADELINQELILEDAKEKKYDQDKEFIDELNIVKDNMLKNYAMHKVFESVSITDDELEKYYEDNKETLFSPTTYTASHILVDSEDEANKIYDELNEGLDFAKAAEKYSKDPSGVNGGSLGSFPKGVMVREFQDGLDSINVGEISKPIKTQFGYHLIKLDDKKETESSYERVKDQVRSTYEMLKRQEKYMDLANDLSKNAEVKKYY